MKREIRDTEQEDFIVKAYRWKINEITAQVVLVRAAGLAQGLDGQPRDFRGVHDVIHDFQYLKQLSLGKEPAQAETSAKKTAWKRAVRFFRGTDCATPGSYFPKDMVYQEGHVDIWRVIGENPDELVRFNVAKYDSANERHLWILEQAGITDEDLDALAA